ncbi:MAG: DNA recombination protein RmuC [Verrucomicrobia bacterium]|nr:DNA recombination protein RmuC [Verrucomicrobiota bacterium]
MDPLLYLLLGVVLGGVIGWLLGARFRGERQESPLASVNLLEAELRQQLTQREGDLARTRSQLAEASIGLAATEARRSAADKQVEEARAALRVREAELSDTALKLTQTGHQLATTQAQLAGANKFQTEQRELHERQLQEARAAQDKALADLREAFKALSADALKQTQPEFLRLANETLGKFAESAKGDLSLRQEAIATLVKPLEEQLKTYQERLAQSETTQSKTLGEVRQHLESLAQQSQVLSTETLQLRRVLSSNQARGKWGEETLRRVVEAAGMSAHCDFTEQAQSDDKKPDMLVRLPGDRLIIVDAKVPDLDFLNALGTADETKRAESLAAHADKLRNTIKALAERDYPAQFPNALDHVVLFLPAESLFSAALEGDRGLIVWAAERRIMLATPASLIALLRSVSVSWQQHEQTVNAKEIARAAEELFSRVATFAKHFENVGAGLERATKAYNEAIGSYDRSVRPSGERLIKLGAGTGGKSLPELELLHESLRSLPPAEAGSRPA